MTTLDWSARLDAVCEVAARHADDVDRQARLPSEALSELRRQRLLAVPVDGAARRRALPAAVAACDRIAQACASTGLIFAMHHAQAASLMAGFEATPGRARFMDRIAAGEFLLASSTTEGRGGDIRKSDCFVQRRDNGRIAVAREGAVVSYAAAADGILLTAREDEAAPASRQVMVLLLREQLQLAMRGGWDAFGMRGTASCAYAIEGEANADHVSDVPFAGILQDTMLPLSHLLWSACWIGIARGAARKAARYLRERLPPDNPRAAPAARRLDEAWRDVASAEALLAACLGRHLREGGANLASALEGQWEFNHLKVRVSEAAVRAVRQAADVCGLDGYRNDGPFAMGRHLRDSLSSLYMLHNDRIAAAMMESQNALGDRFRRELPLEAAHG
ncbi:MAG: acyl-CoA dehydrogenase family protein [Pseudomonadota bacterium]